MKEKLSATNVSFDFLSNSSEFLRIVLNNISSCVLLLDHKMQLYAFNDALKTIFSNKENEDLLYQRCGEAIGCAYQVEEQTECGNTNHCQFCELRLAAMDSYTNDKEIFKDKISRPFFNNNFKKVVKHLQFSTRLFYFNRFDKYIIMIIDDITPLTEP